MSERKKNFPRIPVDRILADRENRLDVNDIKKYLDWKETYNDVEVEELRCVILRKFYLFQMDLYDYLSNKHELSYMDIEEFLKKRWNAQIIFTKEYDYELVPLLEDVSKPFLINNDWEKDDFSVLMPELGEGEFIVVGLSRTALGKKGFKKIWKEFGDSLVENEKILSQKYIELRQSKKGGGLERIEKVLSFLLWFEGFSVTEIAKMLDIPGSGKESEPILKVENAITNIAKLVDPNSQILNISNRSLRKVK